jgi:hypothetical protein
VTTIVLAATRLERIREALRAALGLGLRGGPVAVWLGPGVAPHRDDPAVARALALLVELGHALHEGEPPPAAATIDKRERWTDDGGLDLVGDPDAVVSRLFEPP